MALCVEETPVLESHLMDMDKMRKVWHDMAGKVCRDLTRYDAASRMRRICASRPYDASSRQELGKNKDTFSMSFHKGKRKCKKM